MVNLIYNGVLLSLIGCDFELPSALPLGSTQPIMVMRINAITYVECSTKITTVTTDRGLEPGRLTGVIEEDYCIIQEKNLKF
jgi:hypothetical protein